MASTDAETTSVSPSRTHSSARTLSVLPLRLLVPSLLLPFLAVLATLAWLGPPSLRLQAHSEYYTRILMASPPPRTLCFGSFNVRMDAEAAHPVLFPLKQLADSVSTLGKEKSNGSQKWGERPWTERREKLVDQVLWSGLDVVGFQEVLNNQLRDLVVLMGDEWDYVGVGRNDGRKAGEAVPIFFRKSRFTLLTSSHFWLSPTPSVPGSKGWDADQTRMVTAIHLHDKQGSPGKEGEEIVVVNTHWDHLGTLAREKSAELILDKLEQEIVLPKRKTGEHDPLIVLLGDLNSMAEEKGYQILTDGKYGGEKSERAAFADARHEVAARGTKMEGPGALSGRFGPLHTFTGFLPSDVPKIIDFIFPFSNDAFVPPSESPPAPVREPLSNDTSVDSTTKEDSSKALHAQTRWKVSRYGVIPNFFEDLDGGRVGEQKEDSMLVSDHRLVIAAFEEVLT